MNDEAALIQKFSLLPIDYNVGFRGKVKNNKNKRKRFFLNKMHCLQLFTYINCLAS